jgi:beta-alanine--pyruvate transaminase
MPPQDAPFPGRLDASELHAYWLPFTANRAFKRRPRLIDRAEGMYYYTQDGRSLLDAMSGLLCCNAGHCRAPIIEAISRQAARLDYAPSFQAGHAAAFQLTSRLAKLAPGELDRVFFCNSGSEAVDTALKIALAYHKLAGASTRTRFVSRERSYHGSCLGGTSVGGIAQNRNLFEPLLDTIQLRSTYSRERQAYSRGEPEWGGDLADGLSAILALEDRASLAAVIVEPMAGAAGVFASPQGYLQRLREITRDHGILLIFDEVITGFGRLGHAFAAERYGVVPDMICFAKGVTKGAAPLGGVVLRGRIHDAFMQGPEHVPELAHGFTYSIRSASPRQMPRSTFIAMRGCSSRPARSSRFSPTPCTGSKAPPTSSISEPSGSPPASTLPRSTGRRAYAGRAPSTPPSSRRTGNPRRGRHAGAGAGPDRHAGGFRRHHQPDPAHPGDASLNAFATWFRRSRLLSRSRGGTPDCCCLTGVCRRMIFAWGVRERGGHDCHGL